MPENPVYWYSMGEFEVHHKPNTPVCLPDIPLCQTARTFLRLQAESLTAHLNGAAVRQDIEDVHQVRVACRRMRAGLVFFGDCFDDDKADRWRKQLKKALSRFGPARDCDVQITFLDNRLKTLDPQQKNVKPGIKRLLLRAQQQRDALQPGIAKAVRRLAKEHLLLNVHLETERLLYETEHADAEAFNVRFYDRSAEQVERSLTDVLEKRPALNNASAVTDHHALRIAVKKLRYTLEVCDTGLEGRLKPILKQLKKLQTLLGELHDCDMWQIQIEAFIGEETGRTKTFFGHTRPMSRLLPGLRFLQTQRQQERQRLFETASALVHDLDTEGFWNSIVQAVRQDAPLPDNVDSANESDTDDDADRGQ